MDVYMVEMPTDRHRPNLVALTRGWSALPPPPAAPGPGAVTVWTGTHWSCGAARTAAVAWTGQEVLVWGGGVEGRSFGDGAAYHPARDTWRALPPAPIPARAPAAWAWTRQELLAWDYEFCSEHALWDQRSRRWERVGRDLELAAVVAAGPVFLFAGAETGPAGPGSGRLVAYNPG